MGHELEQSGMIPGNSSCGDTVISIGDRMFDAICYTLWVSEKLANAWHKYLRVSKILVRR